MSHLSEISFRNFRVFDKKTSLELAPITFLTGPNSSGKSSILKALLLLKSNYSSILQVLDFSGPKHNLGTFENTLNNQTNGDCLTIGLKTHIGPANIYGSGRGSFNRQAVTTKRSVYSILVEAESSKRIPITAEFTYQRNDRSGKLLMLEIFTDNNETSFLKLNIGDANSESFHELYIDTEKLKEDRLSAIFHFPVNMMDGKPKKEKSKPKVYSHSTTFAPKESEKERYVDDPLTVFNKLFSKYVQENFDFDKVRRRMHSYFITYPLRHILSDFAEITDNLEYLEAVRANTKRIYTNDSQGTSFNELILEYRSREIPEESREFTNKWLKRFEIADSIRFANIEGVATTIFLQRGEKSIALADLGYGITQFLPILLKIALEVPTTRSKTEDAIVVKKTILLEEPETNLHPKLQSQIADFLIDAIKRFEVRFIIETHSEYIIRKMQILTADNKIKPSETVIYYFNGENHLQESKIKKIEIKQNGTLTNEFGEGFFDEATSLKLNLLKKKEVK